MNFSFSVISKKVNHFIQFLVFTMNFYIIEIIILPNLIFVQAMKTSYAHFQLICMCFTALVDSR